MQRDILHVLRNHPLSVQSFITQPNITDGRQQVEATLHKCSSAQQIKEIPILKINISLFNYFQQFSLIQKKNKLLLTCSNFLQ